MAKTDTPVTKLEFKCEGTFQSLYAAQHYLSINGYSYGSTSINRFTGASEPVPIRKGEYDLPQKWHNLSKEEKKSVDGVMRSVDYRNGKVIIELYS